MTPLPNVAPVTASRIRASPFTTHGEYARAAMPFVCTDAPYSSA